MQLVRHKGRVATQIVEGYLPAPISLRILRSRTTAHVIIETEVSDCNLDLVRDCIGQVIARQHLKVNQFQNKPPIFDIERVQHKIHSTFSRIHQ